MQRIKAEPENCVHFYCDGWRYGEIVNQSSENRITVQDCTGSKFRCRKHPNGKWVATRSKEFKEQKDIYKDKPKKEKAHGKKKIKIKRASAPAKKRFKIKIKKR